LLELNVNNKEKKPWFMMTRHAGINNINKIQPKTLKAALNLQMPQ